MKRVITIIFLAICFLSINVKLSAFVFPWEDKDKLLLDAITNNQLEKFEYLLKKGANPNTIFGSERHEWVMCLSNKNENIDFLRLAIEYGGDINLRNRIEPVKTITSAPILCAITYRNENSFDFLMKHNVDLSIYTFENAQPIPADSTVASKYIGKTLFGSPIVLATDFSKYCMVYKALQHKELNWEELEGLIRGVETSNIDPDSKDNKCRLEIIEILRQQGHDIDPERAKKNRKEIRAELKKKKAELEIKLQHDERVKRGLE